MHFQFAAPRWSPDGRSIALAVWTEGRQDIALFDVDTRSLRMITQDRATDLTPSWSRDGHTLYFTSDSTGVFNVFAYTLADESLSRVTNVLGGVFMPSVSLDGRGIVVANYSSRGFDLHRLELDTARAKPVARSSEPRPAPTTKPIPASVSISESTPAPYSPIPSVTPRFWAPVLSADEEGGQYGLTTGGLDVLGYHKYALTAVYGPSSGRASYVLDYRFDRLYPSFDVSVSDVAALYGDFFQDANGNTSEYWEHRQRLDADIVLPIFKTRWTQTLSVGYRRERLSDLSLTPFGAQPPAVGNLQRVGRIPNGIGLQNRRRRRTQHGHDACLPPANPAEGRIRGRARPGRRDARLLECGTRVLSRDKKYSDPVAACDLSPFPHLGSADAGAAPGSQDPLPGFSLP